MGSFELSDLVLETKFFCKSRKYSVNGEPSFEPLVRSWKALVTGDGITQDLEMECWN